MSEFKEGDRVRYEADVIMAKGKIIALHGSDAVIERPDGGEEMIHVSYLSRIDEPQPFKVGDRVRRVQNTGLRDEFDRGVVVMIGRNGIIHVRGDGWDEGRAVTVHPDNLTRIEEPQPWQGKCAYYRCNRPLRAGHAHIYHDADYGTAATHGCEWYCEDHFDVLTLGSRPPTREDQPAALAASREWMAGRYPDEAKWQEATP